MDERQIEVIEESTPQDLLRVRGFFRINLTEAGEDGEVVVVGDSGWVENTVTNEGKRDYLARALGALASSKQVSHAALGTGGAPAVGDTTLAGELDHAAGSRDAVSAATNGSTAVRFTGTFASADNHNTTTLNISNIGLFQTSTTNVATIFAGAAYASSSWATNQSVNYTYDITFT
jgi:hypothetical protein